MEIKKYNDYYSYEFEDRIISRALDRLIRKSFGITNEMIHKSSFNNDSVE